MNFALLQRQTGSLPGRMYEGNLKPMLTQIAEDKLEDFSKRITDLEQKI